MVFSIVGGCLVLKSFVASVSGEPQRNATLTEGDVYTISGLLESNGGTSSLTEGVVYMS